MINKAFFKKPQDRTEQEKAQIQKEYSCLGCEAQGDCLECKVFANQIELEQYQELINEGRE